MDDTSPTPTLADRFVAPLQRFLAIEAASTILLLAATGFALAAANSTFADRYAALWETKLRFGLGDHELALSLGHWVNDGLMGLFFFLVGMEIKHELVHGELSSRERAMLPLVGAVGGMVVPASIYAALHAGGPAASGWGVPMATDIAFAVAALALLGRRASPSLKVFLLALAIVDDLGAVAVIALLYTETISFPALAAAAAGLALVYALNRAGVRTFAVYWAVGGLVWLATLASGVHATVAGVLLGFLTPTTRFVGPDSLAARGRRFAEDLIALAQEGRIAREGKRVYTQLGTLRRDVLSPLDTLMAGLHPWTAFFVMPVFALANAGVTIELEALREPVALRVAGGVALGLLVGKPLGITLACWLGVRAGLARLPEGIGFGAIAGVGLLAGIGFTMALFITMLAFDDPRLAAASKVGVMAASAVAAALGLAVLRRTLPRGGGAAAPAPPPLAAP